MILRLLFFLLLASPIFGQSLVFRTAVASTQFDPRRLGNLVAWFKADCLISSTTGFTGTGTVAQTTTTVTGVGTSFLSELVIGDKISGTGFNETVTAVANNTSATVDTSGTVGAGAVFTVTPQAGVTDRVTTWSDQSGLGHDFTQATLSKCGILANASINGRPVVRMDAFNDFMAAATFSLVQPVHVFAVAKYNQAFGAAANLIDGTANNAMKIVRSATGTMGISAGTTLTATGNTPQSFHIYAMEFSGTSSAIKVDENSITSSGDAGTAAPGGFTLNSNVAGTAAFGGTDIPEILVYNRILSASERLQVEGYLAKKYGLTLTQ